MTIVNVDVKQHIRQSSQSAHCLTICATLCYFTRMASAERESIHDSKTADALSRIVRIIAYPVAGVSGYLAGDVSVRNSIYKNFAKHGYFDGKKGKSSGGIQHELHEEFVSIVKEKYKKQILGATDEVARTDFMKRAVKFHVFTPQEIEEFAEPAKTTAVKEAFKAAKHSLHDKFTQSAAKDGAVASRFEHLFDLYRKEVREFFVDLEIKGPLSYPKVLNRNQKVEATVIALTAAGVSLGSLLTIANNRGLLDALSPRRKSSDCQPGAN
jgi:hypothetical protein